MKKFAAMAFAILFFLAVHPASAQSDSVPVRGDSVIDLVYLGAMDCPPCRGWKNFDLPKLRATKEFQHIRFTDVQKWITDPVPAEDALPLHLRTMRGEIVRVINRKNGSPMFALLVDGKGLRGGWGTSTYEKMLPVIEELVSRKLAAGKLTSASMHRGAAS